MSRRKAVHIPKVWEVEEISDDDDENIEEMQREVEDILSKITNKKKTLNTIEATPLHFDIKVEVEEFDEQPSRTGHSNQTHREPTPSTSKNRLSNNQRSNKKQNLNNQHVQQSLSIQALAGVSPESDMQLAVASCSQSPPQTSETDNLDSKSKLQKILKPNTYSKCKNSPPIPQPIEQSKSSVYQQFDLDKYAVKMAMENLSINGSVADYYIYLLMMNYNNMPIAPVESNLEIALQKVLAVWRDWFLQDIDTRQAPLLYKCKTCGWAWWNLHSFREHLRQLHRGLLGRVRFEFEATNGESYIAMKITQFKKAAEVRIVNAPCWRCGMLPGVKYRSFDTTTLMYHCKCRATFTTCYEYRLHLDACVTEAAHRKRVSYKCHLCFLRFDSTAQLKNHRVLSHTVRSDIPAAWTTNRKCKRCGSPYYYGMHDCPTVKRTVSCGYCTQKFTNPAMMKLHQGFSKEDVRCRLCDRVLKRQCMELMHLVEHTNNYVLLHQCVLCEDSTYFHNDSAYNIHLLGRHPLADQCAMKVPVPVKCLRDSGYKIKVPASVVPIKGDACDSRKRKAARKESSSKRIKRNSDENTNNINSIKVEDQSVEEFINTENEINEMILLKNKNNNTLLKVKLENFCEDDFRAEENIVNNKVNSSVNENDNSEKHESWFASNNQINEDSNTVKIKLENIEEDNNRRRENEVNAPGKEINLNTFCNKDNPKTNDSHKENNKMCLANKSGIEKTTSSNSYIHEKENTGSEISKEDDNSREKIDFKAPIEGNIIISDVTCNDFNQVISNSEKVVNSVEKFDFEAHIEENIVISDEICNETSEVISNIVVKSKIGNSRQQKENNTCNKLIVTDDKKKCVYSNASNKKIHNSNILENAQNNKEDEQLLKDNTFLVNQNELNVKIINVTTGEVPEDKDINNAKEKDTDIQNITSASHNIPDKEDCISKQIDCPGPSIKRIKVEQENIMEINRDVEIKEEILDDDTDDEKLVIAEFNELIRDKSVKLEVKEEPDEYFEDDMIVWAHNDDSQDENNVVELEDTNDYLVWTPHLGVVGGGHLEREKRSDDDDDNLSLLDRKKCKKSFRRYTCKRCKFQGNHKEYKQHKRCCAAAVRSMKKFNPVDCSEFRCTTCGALHSSLHKYLKHLPVHGYSQLQCPECDQMSPSKAQLLQHVMFHINKQYVPKRGILSATKSGFKMQCTQCSAEVEAPEFFFHWEHHLSARRRERERSLGLEEFAPKSPLLRELIELLLDRTQDPEGEHKKLRWCKVCSRRFTRSNECKRHYIEHLLDDAYAHITDVRGLRCQICGELWEKQADFRLHIRGHAAMPVYRCELCGKTFSDSSNFAKHRKVHNLCSFVCDLCHKKFNRKRSLVEHIKLHEMQKPIECPVSGCDKVLYSETAYKKHCKVNHGHAQYPCQICKEKFDTIRAMWDHKWQVHKMRNVIADCPLCHMQFRKYSDVKTHLRTVHNESFDLKRLNSLTSTEKTGNVAQLVDDVVVLESESAQRKCRTFARVRKVGKVQESIAQEEDLEEQDVDVGSGED